MKKTFFISFFCLIIQGCLAQPFGVLKHFSHDVKLSQSHILDIKQDQKGFIWLGTFNGLIRYDGNTFQNFEVLQRGRLNLLSNRVSDFKFDKNGKIWIKSQREEVYYFDTQKLSYHYPLGGQSKDALTISFKDFKLMSSGNVWLFPENKNLLIVLKTNNSKQQIDFDKAKIKVSNIKEIYEDTTGTTWFLTDLGVCKLKKGAIKPEYFFFGMSKFSGKSYCFTTLAEINDEIWFGGTNGKLSRYSKKGSTFFDLPLQINSDILQIKYLAGGKVLMVTKTEGLCYFDLKSGKIDFYNSKTIAGFPAGTINYVGLTHFRQFWFETSASGVFKFDLITKKLKHLMVKSSDPTMLDVVRKTFLLTAPNGSVWVQPKGGALAYWDQEQDKLFSISQFMKQSSVEVSDVMHTVTFDKSGNLWFCSYKKGLDLMIFNNNNFTTLKFNNQQNKKNNNVRALMQDKKGNLWVACRSENITLFDSKKNKIGMLGSNGTLSANSPGWGADIYHIFEDKKGRIWLGTRGNGLYCLIPNQKPFTYKVLHYKYDEGNKYSISANDIYRIFQAASGTIYLATWGGGLNLVQETKNDIRFINYRNHWKNYPIKYAEKVRSIVENKEHQLFFISSYKLFSFSETSKIAEKIKIKMFSQIEGNDLLDIIITSKNKLALATNGKGMLLVDWNKSGGLKIQSFCEKTIHLPLDEVVALQEDKLGKLWLMADNQVVRFDLDKKTAETFPQLKHLIGNEIFSEATKCRLANGEIVLGFSNGAICFKPQNYKPVTFKPYLAITGFVVNNKELSEINPDAPTNPDLLKEVELEHNQNFFRVQFSALDFVNNENIMYRYKLEGIDQDWNYTKAGQSINYTNLSRGTYTLLLSSTNNHNLWMNNQRKIKITILPSIWWTNLAIVCYILLAIGLFIVIRRTFLTIIKLRNDVQIQQEVSELKLKFFTDISHEIRTPLTMITAPLEKMLADANIPTSVKKQLEGIERNSNRLLNLVNQILDLRRLQNRKLEVKPVNLAEFAAKVCENFSEISLQSNISLSLNITANQPIIWADADSLDKILVNLISNAFKYCHAGDAVEVLVEESEKQLILKVRDNGPGINPAMQKRLFIRFSNYNENPNNPSTGIGLSIVKDLVQKHQATIVVDSTPNKGSCFVISFLKGYAHFDEDATLLFEQSDDYLLYDLEKIEEEVLEIESENKNSKPIGLVVEDDPELRRFIVSVLEHDYTIYEAENGFEGSLKAKNLAPNFIISDIMMPQMDGIEMLKLIRNNLATSHIPVVLLSAKTAIESKLEGLEFGADDYISKPFNVSFFKARVKNILEQRLLLQSLYATGKITEILEKEPPTISNKDHKFMTQVIQFVNENMSKSDFSVDELGKLMYMSRASFFNKLKSITGVSPVTFIRDMRLDKAAILIKNEEMLIKEICFEVGFNDLKYFGKCFKTKFNATPAEYRQLHR